MEYLLLVQHNEEAFNKIPEGTRKDRLVESIQLCHQLDDKYHSETTQEQSLWISQWEKNSNVALRRTTPYPLIERIAKFRVNENLRKATAGRMCNHKEATMRIISCALISLLTVSPVLAKEKKHDNHMDPQAMMELWKQAATPGEPHKRFAALAGSWTTQTKEWMEPGKPPTESSGTAELKMLLDGRFLYQEFNGQMMGQPFNGIGIDGYDNIHKKYVTVWMDSMGTGFFMMEGTASPDGKTITLKGSHPEPGGGHMSHRAIWKLIDDNTQQFDMYGAHHGQKEMKMMEILYTRKP